MTSRYEPNDEDMHYARTTAARFSAGHDHMAIVAAQLMAANLDGLDGEHASVDDYRIRRARAFGRVWHEYTEPADERRRG